MEAYNLLPSRQSAYRAHQSTESAVIDVHNRILRNMDRGGHASVLVLLDLSSAFDTVDHAILLEVLEKRFGVTGIVLKWYCSYVDGRSQTFQVGSQLSATFVVHYGVPQVRRSGRPRSSDVCGLHRGPTGCNSATIYTPATPNYLMSRQSHPSRHPSRTCSTVSWRSTPGALLSGSS